MRSQPRAWWRWRLRISGTWRWRWDYFGRPSDPETGGQYTVKLYWEEKEPKNEKRIVLQPANAEFAPLVIARPEADGVRVIAEVVEVLGA